MGVVPNLNEAPKENQVATDPRLEVPVIPVNDTSVENQETPETPEVPSETPKPKKTTEEVLKGRIGHMTKIVSTKDQEIAAAVARAEAAEHLLAASQRQVPNPDGTPLERPPVVSPVHNKTYSQDEFEAAVAAKVEADTFNQRADEMYNQGAAKYDDWKDSVDTLVAAGFMNKDLLDAAMAVDDGTDVLHHLGNNLDEAERLFALSPTRRATEMLRLSMKLSTPVNAQVSNAPTPIRPVSGSPNPTVDLQKIADDSDMSSWVIARKKQGSRWAQR